MSATRYCCILMPWGRVGSNLVTAALAASPGVVVENEPTTRLKTYGLRDGLSEQDIGDQQFRHLSEFHETHAGTGHTALLKLSFRSLIDPDCYMARLVALGFRPVLMLRDNFLKCAVSQLRASVRNAAPAQERTHWQSPWSVASHEPKPGPVDIDPVKAIRLTREFKKFQQALLEAAAVFGPDAVQIEYRELASDPQATIRKVYTAFGLNPPGNIHLPYRKATSELLCEDITNYAAFEEAVQDAGLGRYLANDL